MRLSAGRLKHRLTFQTYTEENDGYNTKTWRRDFDKRGEIISGQSSEIEKSGRIMGDATHIIRLRYSKKITEFHRIKHDDITYEIIGKPVNVDFANTVTEIKVKEISYD